MKSLIKIVMPAIIAVALCSCYSGVAERINCPRFSLPDSVKSAGLAIYYNRKIDVDWLDEELPHDNIEQWLETAITKHISKSKISDEEKTALTKKTIAEATARWQTYKAILKNDDLVCSYAKTWFQIGSTTGLVVIRNCTIIGDIHFPEMKK